MSDLSNRVHRFGGTSTGGTAVACAELLSEHFAVLRAKILIVSLIDLPALGCSQIIHERGFNVASLMTYP